MPAKSSPTQSRLRRFAIEAARLLEDRHCEDVRLLDVRGLSQVCDYILLANGTSDRQMRAVAAELGDLAATMGERLYRTSMDDNRTWVVADFVDLVVHLFEPNQRAYYDLESLWSDAKSVRWQRGAAEKSQRAATKKVRRK